MSFNMKAATIIISRPQGASAGKRKRFRFPLRFSVYAALAGAIGLAATPPQPAAGQDDPEAQLSARHQAARTQLEARMESRLAAGWSPKSADRQLVTRLQKLEDVRARMQEIEKSRALFEAARASVYEHLTQNNLRARVNGLVAEQLRGVVESDDSWMPYDPVAMRLSAQFGSRATPSAEVAAALEFHGRTYDNRSRQAQTDRLRTLDLQIGLNSPNRQDESGRQSQGK